MFTMHRSGAHTHRYHITYDRDVYLPSARALVLACAAVAVKNIAAAFTEKAGEHQPWDINLVNYVGWFHYADRLLQLVIVTGGKVVGVYVQSDSNSHLTRSQDCFQDNLLLLPASL